MTLKAAVVGSDALLRDGIAALLTMRATAETASTFATVDELLASPGVAAVDVALIDCVLPGVSALASALTRLQAAYPSCAIVSLVHRRDMRVLVPLISGRRRAWVLKEGGFSELESAMAAVLAGENRAVPADGFDGKPAREGATAVQGPRLSSREREVMQLIACGQRTRDIAQRLSLSPKTIEKHRSSLMRKIGARNVAGVALFAVRQSETDAQLATF